MAGSLARSWALTSPSIWVVVLTTETSLMTLASVAWTAWSSAITPQSSGSGTERLPGGATASTGTATTGTAMSIIIASTR